MGLPNDSLTEEALVFEAGDRVFERGTQYRHFVDLLSRGENFATAHVRGSQTYHVTLHWEDELRGSCTCLHNLADNFCKHLVALGLTVLGEGSEEHTDDTSGGRAEHSASIPEYLNSLSQEQLRQLLWSLASHDYAIMNMLQRKADLSSGNTAAIENELQQRYKAVFSVRGFIDYWRAIDFSQEVDIFLNEVEILLDDGYSDLVAPILLKTATRLRKMIAERIDDSSGAPGEVCQRAINLYAQACRSGNPDTKKLGRWLAKFRLDSPGWPVVTLGDFVSALGDQGLTAYRRAVNTELERRSDEELSGWNAHEINSMELELADHDGDVDHAIKVLSRGEHPRYGAIIQRLEAAQRPREAMAYLERAIAEDRVTSNPRHWCGDANDYHVSPVKAVDMFLHDGREEDAIAFLRDLFHSAPLPEIYDLLISTASDLGCAEAEQQATRVWVDTCEWGIGDLPVRIALHLGDVEWAWSLADRWPLRAMWQDLAEASPQPRPREAIGLYQTRIIGALDATTGREVAREAARMTLSAMRIARTADKHDDAKKAQEGQGPLTAEMTRWIAQLREDYRRRPTVNEELARVGL